MTSEIKVEMICREISQYQKKEKESYITLFKAVFKPANGKGRFTLETDDELLFELGKSYTFIIRLDNRQKTLDDSISVEPDSIEI